MRLTSAKYTLIRTFRAAVDERFQALRIFWVDEVYECCVDPSPCFYRVQATNYEVELHVVVIILVLDFAVVPVSNLSAFP